ncbi:hypothetical protein PV678_43080, partial [Streptomyces europaeiscabiei]|nr:hypothetical protein [Streptomyces europaeiscabiei]
MPRLRNPAPPPGRPSRPLRRSAGRDAVTLLALPLVALLVLPASFAGGGTRRRRRAARAGRR